MSKFNISNIKGETVGDVEIPDSIVKAAHNPQTLQNELVAHRANQRGGNHSTLTKGEVAGSGKKPWKQKGTGRARAGYKQSPVWRGGGVVFGPKPRDYSKDITKKSSRAALRLAFSQQLEAGVITFVDKFEIGEAKTKSFVRAVQLLKMERGGLVVVDSVSRELALASRNVPGVKLCDSRSVNSYELMRAPRVLMTQAGLAQFQQRLEISTEAA